MGRKREARRTRGRAKRARVPWVDKRRASRRGGAAMKWGRSRWEEWDKSVTVGRGWKSR